MRTLRIALLLVGVAALGCRTNSDQVLLERDLRLQEDKIYELESMLDDVHAAREATLRENDSLKKELAGGDRGPDVRSPAVETPSGAEPRRRPGREPGSPEVPKLEVPTIEMPEPGGPGGVEVNPAEPSAEVLDAPPTQLVFDKRLTGGLDRDGHPGDEGIMVAFEPRDAAGRLVNGPGAVSIVVLDPAVEGEASRVARWDFTPEEVPGHFHSTIIAKGLQFELPWPGEPPKNRELRLFVRFTRPDGQKITADTTINVRGPGAVAQKNHAPRGGSSGPASRLLRAKPPAERESADGDQAESSDDIPAADASAARSRADRDVPERDASDEDADSSERSNPSVDRSPSDHTRQATRPDRPVWKPYR